MNISLECFKAREEKTIYLVKKEQGDNVLFCFKSVKEETSLSKHFQCKFLFLCL